MMGLLAEETVETEIEGQRRKIRLLNPELGLIDTAHADAPAPRRRRAAARGR